MVNYFYRSSFIICLFVIGIFFSCVVSAQVITGPASDDAVKQLNSAGSLVTSDSRDIAQDPRVTVAIVIRYFLSLLGTILLILIVMSGYWYFTARGDDEKITRAQTTIKQALMGMIIILSAYAVTTYTINTLTSTLKGGDQTHPGDEYRLGDIINAR